MKRMVKNGDLIDVEPDGTITVAGKPVGGGGSDYTAGKNITISEAKEISLPDNIASLKSISFFKNSASEKVEIKQSDNYVVTIASNNLSYLPSFRAFAGDGIANQDLTIRFDNVPINKISDIIFDLNKIEKNVYPFISRTRIPDVPSGDGTYILKATVSNGTLTYSWELQQ